RVRFTLNTHEPPSHYADEIRYAMTPHATADGHEVPHIVVSQQGAHLVFHFSFGCASHHALLYVNVKLFQCPRAAGLRGTVVTQAGWLRWPHVMLGGVVDAPDLAEDSFP